MADIKDQLIKDSYNYVLQSDLSTGVVYRIGGAIPVNPIFSSGLTVNSGFTYSNGTEQPGYILTTDGSGYSYWAPSSGVTSITVGNGLSASSSTGAVTIVFTGSTGVSGDYLPLSGGTVTGNTIFQSGLTANTISATTYYNLPSFSGGTITGLTINGPLTVIGNTSLQGLTATTISATTYQNLPSSFQSVRITGTTQFSANTGNFINFSGVNVSITSASTNTLVFSGSPQFTVPGSNNQVLTSDGSGGAVAESLLTFDGAATSPTLNVNGVRVGRGNFNVCTNISIGGVAFSGVAPGGNNIAIGQQSQTSNLGQGNTSIGYKSLRSKTIGDFNISLGHKSMGSAASNYFNCNISIGYKNMYTACGQSNISIGNFALYRPSICMSSNVVIGNCSLLAGTNVFRNVGVGTSSLENLYNGYDNIGIGDNALRGCPALNIFSRNIGLGTNTQAKRVSGQDNISMGVCSQYYGFVSNRNISIGTESLKINSNGSNDNIALGTNSLLGNGTGSKNIAIGSNAIRENRFCSTGGIGNIGIGYDSLRNNSSSSDHNIAIGQAALYYNTNLITTANKPDFNVAIGRCSMLNNNNGCENIAIDE